MCAQSQLRGALTRWGETGSAPFSAAPESDDLTL